jgi:hypothetical protein
MVFDNRPHFIKKYDDVDQLAKDLVNSTWTLCAGFEYQGLLILNDAFTEDGAQEFAVVIPTSSDFGIQVESITFSWIKDVDRAKELILECLDYKNDFSLAPIRIPVKLERVLNHPEGRCKYCW